MKTRDAVQGRDGTTHSHSQVVNKAIAKQWRCRYWSEWCRFNLKRAYKVFMRYLGQEKDDTLSKKILSFCISRPPFLLPWVAMWSLLVASIAHPTEETSFHMAGQGDGLSSNLFSSRRFACAAPNRVFLRFPHPVGIQEWTPLWDP